MVVLWELLVWVLLSVVVRRSFACVRCVRCGLSPAVRPARVFLIVSYLSLRSALTHSLVLFSPPSPVLQNYRTRPRVVWLSSVPLPRGPACG